MVVQLISHYIYQCKDSTSKTNMCIIIIIIIIITINIIIIL